MSTTPDHTCVHHTCSSRHLSSFRDAAAGGAPRAPRQAAAGSVAAAESAAAAAAAAVAVAGGGAGAFAGLPPALARWVPACPSDGQGRWVRALPAGLLPVSDERGGQVGQSVGWLVGGLVKTW
jgi:hypothetical protein